MGDLDQPGFRKKHQAKDKKKHKNISYSQKHVRLLEKIIDNNIKQNEQSENGPERGGLCNNKKRK